MLKKVNILYLPAHVWNAIRKWQEVKYGAMEKRNYTMPME
jgi:hypothetical protein